jgi:hydrogenase maturation protease
LQVKSNMPDAPRILVAGIGNIFLGDDAFGSEAARRLEGRPWPEGVRIVDFGIRGFDLLYALGDRHDLVVLIDATSRGGSPGTLYMIEADVAGDAADTSEDAAFDAHTLDPMRVLRIARLQGASLPAVLVVGCEPGDLGGEEGRLGLSDPVAAAIDEAVELVASLVHLFRDHWNSDRHSLTDLLTALQPAAPLTLSERGTFRSEQ